jgi:hypothetical protein
MNVFLAAYLVGAFVYGVHVYWTVKLSQARRAIGVYHDTDQMIEEVEKRGLLSFVFVLGAFLFPLSLAYDCVLNGQQVEKLRDAKKQIDVLEQNVGPALADSNETFMRANVHLFLAWMRYRMAGRPDLAVEVVRVIEGATDGELERLTAEFMAEHSTFLEKS